MNDKIEVATENTDTATAAVADTATEILGGVDVATDADTATENTAPVAETPGKAARKRTGEKREYTPRGTTYWARRVILLNGEPVGRGRPSLEGKGERKVVYVPVGMEYDVAVHGEGVKYNTHSHRATHKRIAKDSVSYTFDDGVAPTATKPTKATKTKAKAKNEKANVTKGKAKATKVKAKTKTNKKAKKSADVNVPVADVAPSVEPAPSVEIPATTDAVSA
jgi:hypothetical protein